MNAIAETLGSVKERTIALEKIASDHESRLRKLERFAYLVVAGLYVVEKLVVLFIK